jgi:hypothetical protein
MTAKARRLVPVILHVLFVFIYVFTTSLAGVIKPMTVHASEHAAPLADYASRVVWKTIDLEPDDLESGTYDVHRIVENGSEKGIFATEHDNLNRVNPALEEQLVLIAETMERYGPTYDDIDIPGTGYSVFQGEQYTFGQYYNLSQANGSQTCPDGHRDYFYHPRYFEFEPNFAGAFPNALGTWGSIVHCVPTQGYVFPALTDTDRRAQAYESAILAAALRTMMSNDYARIQRARDVIEQIAETIDTAGLGVHTVSLLTDAAEKSGNVPYTIPHSELKTLLNRMGNSDALKNAGGNLKYLGPILGTVSSQLTAGGLQVEMGSHVLQASFEQALANADALARLNAIGEWIEANKGETWFDPALEQGFDWASERFNDLNEKKINKLAILLSNPAMLVSVTAFAGGLASVAVGWLAALGGGLISATAAATTITGIGIAIVVISITFPIIIESEEQIRLWRESVMGYDLSLQIADHLPTWDDKLTPLTLLNISWYLRFQYYDRIHQHASETPTSDWVFNTEDAGTPVYTQADVLTEAIQGRTATETMVQRTADSVYLTEQERQEAIGRILLRGAENNLALGISAPAEGQNFVKGDVVPLQAQAYSDAGIKQVDFYVYPQNGNRGTPFCTDDDGPSGVDELWTCPSNPGWDTFGATPGSYYVEVEATNTFDNSVSDLCGINIVQVDDDVQVTANLDPETLQVGQTFTVTGQVTVNGIPEEAQVKIEVVGQGIQETTVSAPSTGDYSKTDISVPQTPGNYQVKVTASTPDAAGYTIRTLGVSANPMEGSRLAITDFEASDHVEPGDEVRFRAFVHNQGTVPMTFKLVYELRDPNGNPVGGTPDYGPVTTLQADEVYPGFSADVRRFSTTSTSGTYTAIAYLVGANNEPFSDQTPDDNRFPQGVMVSDTNDYYHYQITSQYADVGETKTYSIQSSFTVQVHAVNTNEDRALLSIWQGSTPIAQSEWFDEYEEEYLQGNTIYMYIDYIGGDSVSWTMGEYTSAANFVISPSNPVVAKAGRDAVLFIEGNYRLEDIAVEYGDDAQHVNDYWDPDATTLNHPTRTQWELEFEVPVDEELRTFTFFVSADKEVAPYAYYIEKVHVQVIAPDDVGVSTLSPANGTLYFTGDTVSIDATVHNYASYFEAEVPVSLHITGPDGYSYFDGTTINGLSGGADQPVNFIWGTAGLQAGAYTIRVSTNLAVDPKTNNDALSRSITLDQKPSLDVSASTDQATYGQNVSILLSASVTDPSAAAVPGCLVYAHVTGPSVDETHVMAYNSSSQQYEVGLAYVNLGTYQYTVSVSKEGYLSGETASPGDFTVVNAPPETWITSATPDEGAWVRTDSVTLDWAGSDTTTPAGSLLYSYRLDADSWTAYSGNISETLTSLTEGPHTFYVRAYDGTDADPIPAQRSFNVDTVAPSFDITPTANLSQVADGDTLSITIDLDEAVVPSVNLSALDSHFSSGAVTVQEIDSVNHIYQLSYTLSLDNWRPDRVYNLPIYAQDVAGSVSSNYDLSVRLEDQAPRITAFWPGWDMDVPVDSDINIIFSEDMNQTATQAAFSIEPSVTGQFTWVDGRTFVFTPTVNLECDMAYTVTVSSAAQDLAAKPLTPKSWIFYTEMCGPRITHIPVATAIDGTPVPITATVTSETSPITVTLHYRITGAPDYTDIPMSNTSGDIYEATIPASAVTLAGVDYYISASDVETTTTHPETGYHHITVYSTLDAPSDLSAMAVSRTQINLTWTDNSPDETDFRVERSPNGSTGWQEIGTVDADITTYDDTDLVCGTTYHYRVRAYRSGDGRYSEYSNVDDATTQECLPFYAPSNLIATVASESQIDLTWQDNTSDETAFHIERSPNGSTGWQEIATVGANVTGYSDTGLEFGTVYYYRVRAYRESDETYSDYSNVAYATAGLSVVNDSPTMLGQPTTFTATVMNSDWQSDTQPIETIMVDALLVEHLESGATVDVAGIVADADYGATDQYGFAVWEKIRYAISPDGDLYVGSVGPPSEALAVLIGYNEWWAKELSLRDILLYRLLRLEYNQLETDGYVSGGDGLNGTLGIWNRYGEPIQVLYSALMMFTTYNGEWQYADRLDVWDPSGPGATTYTGDTWRTLDFACSGNTRSFIYSHVFNDNSNSTYIQHDGATVASRGTAIGGDDHILLDGCPVSVEMGGNRTWSELDTSLHSIVVGGSISSTNHAEYPANGGNPVPSVLTIPPAMGLLAVVQW